MQGNPVQRKRGPRHFLVGPAVILTLVGMALALHPGTTFPGGFPYKEALLALLLALLWGWTGWLWHLYRIQEEAAATLRSREALLIAKANQSEADKEVRRLELDRINRYYEMLRKFSKTLLMAQSREALFQNFCDDAVEMGGFRLVWIGWIDETSRQVIPVAVAGRGAGYLMGIEVWADERPEGMGPTGLCIRQERSYICQDFKSDVSTTPWRDKAEAFGLNASIAIPFHFQGHVAGAMMAYTGEAGIFQEKEVALMEEAAAQIAFGLEQLAAQERNRTLQAELSHSQKMESLGSLAGGMAHDMNNVLGAIWGLASLESKHPTDGQSHNKRMEAITKACERGSKLLTGLLGFARHSLAEEKIVNLNDLLQETQALLERTTFQKLQIQADLAQDLAPILGDPGTLAHAVMNLCLNAVDAMPDGGLLALRSRNAPEGSVLLEVEDTGTGMSKEIQEKALDPFFTTKPQGKGSGLGLAMVYGTVKAHGGKLQIQSEPGHGTCVGLSFPAMRTGPLHPGHGTQTCQAAPLSPTPALLIDDDDLVLQSLRAVLEGLGYIVTTAPGGLEGLRILETGFLPQVILLDMNMPGLDGAATLPLLRARLPQTPIVLTTGRSDQRALDLVEAFPKVTLLPKPFGMDELKAHLAQVAEPSGGDGPSPSELT